MKKSLLMSTLCLAELSRKILADYVAMSKKKESNKALKNRAKMARDFGYPELDIVKVCTLQKSVSNHEEKSIVISDSKVHGRGVFATKFIPKCTIVTFYPADIVRYNPRNMAMNENNISFTTFSDKYEQRLPGKQSQQVIDDLFPYEFDLGDEYTIYGIPDFCDDLAYVGHIINDRFKPDGKKIDLDAYNKLSLARTNCAFRIVSHGLHLAIISQRDIKIGEELFIPYGMQYWEKIKSRKT